MRLLVPIKITSANISPSQKVQIHCILTRGGTVRPIFLKKAVRLALFGASVTSYRNIVWRMLDSNSIPMQHSTAHLCSCQVKERDLLQ
jgi:hypothetical protein